MIGQHGITICTLCSFVSSPWFIILNITESNWYKISPVYIYIDTSHWYSIGPNSYLLIYIYIILVLNGPYIGYYIALFVLPILLPIIYHILAYSVYSCLCWLSTVPYIAVAIVPSRVNTWLHSTGKLPDLGKAAIGLRLSAQLLVWEVAFR